MYLHLWSPGGKNVEFPLQVIALNDRDITVSGSKLRYDFNQIMPFYTWNISTTTKLVIKHPHTFLSGGASCL